MNFNPSKASLKACLLPLVPSFFIADGPTVKSSKFAIPYEITAARYGNDRPKTNIKPNKAGPTIIPAWKATDFNATTRSTTLSGDQSIGSARLAGVAKALATPNKAISPNIGVTDVGSEDMYRNRKKDVSASASKAKLNTFLLSKRSATGPVKGDRSAKGRNSARPSKPRLSSLPVIS